MVHVTNLTVRYPGGGGITDINLSIGAGETLSIIGPSGCGKTTLLHCLAGLITPDDGSFRLGEDGTARAGLVQQRDALFPWLTAAENVDLGRRAASRRTFAHRAAAHRHEPDAHIRRLMHSLDIDGLGNEYPDQLSGGERQRVSIARTLASHPDVLLLDEPSSALDAFTRESLQDLLLTLQQEYRFTCLSVTHNIEEALFLSGRVAVMGHGHIAATVDNPNYPDPQARTNRSFYARAVDLRRRLAEVIPDA